MSDRKDFPAVDLLPWHTGTQCAYDRFRRCMGKPTNTVADLVENRRDAILAAVGIYRGLFHVEQPQTVLDAAREFYATWTQIPHAPQGALIVAATRMVEALLASTDNLAAEQTHVA